MGSKGHGMGALVAVGLLALGLMIRWRRSGMTLGNFLGIGLVSLYARLWHRYTANGPAPLPGCILQDDRSGLSNRQRRLRHHSVHPIQFSSRHPFINHELVARHHHVGPPHAHLERRTQARDHPILLTVPETHYLKCLILEVV